jgi:hypothetical protein
MDIPPPGVVRNPGPYLYQTLDQPVHGPFHFFAPDIELPDHVQEVVGQNSHLQPGLVGFKALAAGLVPAQGVFAFFDPVFHIPPAVLDLGHLAAREPGVGDHKADAGEQFAPVPLDLGHYPARFMPALRLILQIHYLDLNPILGRTAH